MRYPPFLVNTKFMVQPWGSIIQAPGRMPTTLVSGASFGAATGAPSAARTVRDRSAVYHSGWAPSSARAQPPANVTARGFRRTSVIPRAVPMGGSGAGPSRESAGRGVAARTRQAAPKRSRTDCMDRLLPGPPPLVHDPWYVCPSRRPSYYRRGGDRQFRETPESRRGIPLLPAQDHLPRAAGADGVEALLELLVGEAVGDHRGDVQPALDHDRHLVPGLVHLAAVDALDGEHVEDDGPPVDRHLLLGDAQHGDLAAVDPVR